MADQKLSALPVATTPSGTELIYLVQGGVSKQSTVSAIASTPTLQQVLTAGSTLAGNNTATGIGDLTLGTDDPGVYTSTIKTSGSDILHTSSDGVDTGLFTQKPNNNLFTKSVTALSFIKSGGTSSQFLKADGTVDSSTYLTTLGTAATSLTTTGSSGAATLISNVLNVPNYTLAGLGGTTLAAVNAQNLSVFAATTSSQLAGVISDETGSGALVFGTSPTFTTNITTPLIVGGSAVGSAITYTSTTGIGTTTGAAHIFNGGTNGGTLGATIYNDGQYIVGTNTRIGGSLGKFQTNINGGIVTLGATGSNVAGLWMQVATPSTANYVLRCDSVDTYINAPDSGGSLFFRAAAASNLLTITSQRTTFSPSVVAGGSITNFTFTTSANTVQTATTNIPNFRISGANKQWATGTVANQYWNYLTANTASFVGASTMTNSYGLFVEAATAGTNATITNNYAAGFGGRVNILSDTATIMIGSQVGSTARGAIYINQATPNTTNFALSAHQTTGSTYINGAGGVNILFNGSIQIIYADKLSTFGSGLTNFDFNFGSTNGTKLGTATTQKLSFWNATPIVQPTTAVAAATVVSGTGGNVKHDDTFDGYTLEKIVKALRNIGLLA